MKIKMTIEIEVDNDVFGQTEEEKLWLENEILIGNKSMLIHSNEIGDYIGEITSVKNIQYLEC